MGEEGKLRLMPATPNTVRSLFGAGPARSLKCLPAALLASAHFCPPLPTILPGPCQQPIHKSAGSLGLPVGLVLSADCWNLSPIWGASERWASCGLGLP